MKLNQFFVRNLSKNFENIYKLLLCLSLACCASAQSRLYSYKFTKTENQRALIVLPSGQILSGSSEAALRLHGPKPLDLERYKLDDQFKEIRDLCYTKYGYIAMQSHDSSCIVLVNKNFEIDSVIFPLQSKQALFLDGICAMDSIVFLLGDPINGKFSTFRSFDYGHSWEPTPGQIDAIEGEAAYAASGQTNQIYEGNFYFVSGGLSSRLFKSVNYGQTWDINTIPYPSCPTCGPYALAIKNENELITVGGDYLKAENKKNNCYYSTDGGKTWIAPKKGPSGYRSCVVYAKECYYACGTTGIDVSRDGGKTWQQISKENALSMAYLNDHLYVTLADGSYVIIKI